MCLKRNTHSCPYAGQGNLSCVRYYEEDSSIIEKRDDYFDRMRALWCGDSGLDAFGLLQH